MGGPGLRRQFRGLMRAVTGIRIVMDFAVERERNRVEHNIAAGGPKKVNNPSTGLALKVVVGRLLDQAAY